MRKLLTLIAVVLLFVAPAAARADVTLFGNDLPSASDGRNEEPETNPGNLGMAFQSDVPGKVDGVRFYKGPDNVGPHTGSLWTANGKLLARIAFTNETASGWQEARFATPVPIAANTKYVVSYSELHGHYSEDYEMFRNQSFDSPPLHGLANPPTPNGLFDFATTPDFPTLTYLWSSYYVDVLFNPAPRSGRAKKFGRMFPNLPGFQYSDQEASDLAAAMINPNPDPPGTNNGTPDDSRTLDAWQTFFGQFLDHNLDFDNTPQPTASVAVDNLVNHSAGVFDLKNLFGDGPSESPTLYAADKKHLKVDCVLGTPLADGFPKVISGNANGACDIARNSDGTPNIFDQRDDENQIISQMDVAWALLYNHFVGEGDSYAKARHLTVSYYKLEIFDQMLPDFVTDPSIIALYAQPTSTPRVFRIVTPNVTGKFMPIEFSVGAYRFGHSLVRNTYTINNIDPNSADPLQNNVPIFNTSHFQVGDLSGGTPLRGTAQQAAPRCQHTNQSQELCSSASDHQIEWKFFFKTLNKNGLDSGQTNQARQTSPTISPNLYNLPAEEIPGCPDRAGSAGGRRRRKGFSPARTRTSADPVCNGSNELVTRDLSRGRWDGLPSGQDVAAALGCPVIPAASLNPTTDGVFDRGTPLEYYVMAEAKQAGTVLACTGSKIIAQVFLRALAGVGKSTFTKFTPDPSLTPFSGTDGNFTFEDLLIDDKLAPPLS